MQSKVLVLHGFDDPMVPPDAMLAFSNEMTLKKADWTLVSFGHTMHAFMNPEANDTAFGTVYNPTIANRSYQMMTEFFKEIFI